jgi:hypothetical protein
MKSFLNKVLLFVLLFGITFCGEDDPEKKLAQNTWTFKSDYNRSTTTYELESVTLSIQGTGQFNAKSKTRYGGGSGGTDSRIIVYFNSMPLADKEYKVTSYNRIATHSDEVAIMINVAGDAEIPGSGGSGSVWDSDGDGSQTLTYKFSNSKGSVEFHNVTLYNGIHAGKKSATTSGKISQ